MISSRRSQAKKTIVVQVNSEKSYPELFHYCSNFGEIKSAFHYVFKQTEQLNFILLEMDKQAQYEEILDKCSFNEQKSGIPVKSPFVWFKARDKKVGEAHNNESIPKLLTQNTKIIEDAVLYESLLTANTINDQILLLYQMTKLNELGTRMRYLAGRQLEMALLGMFPNIQASLFGSSVNGFGKIGCDVDVIIRPNENCEVISEARLIYHTKVSLSKERFQVQRQMETIGDLMNIFLPAISNVRKILNARVPIIKYTHDCLDLDVDFSMNNLTGYYMSELLYLYGEFDERVRPLVFCIRKWASSVGLTNSTAPGRWITNFSLTILVLFFLQNQKNPLLPSMKFLIKSASPIDIRVTDDNVNCTFLRDIGKIDFPNADNCDSLHHLLLQFFEFYSKFDFQEYGISLLEGKPINKPEYAAMWISNPLEPLLNISKNVSFEELEKFKIETRNAAWSLESTIERNKDSWGLPNLFKTNKKLIKPEMFFKSRIVNVTDLFGEDPARKVEFKNPAVRKAVNEIKRTTKIELAKLAKQS
jgi:poly(A) RNA polymerase, mitochondrial